MCVCRAAQNQQAQHYDQACSSFFGFEGAMDFVKMEDGSMLKKNHDAEYDLNSFIDNIPGSVYWKDKEGIYLGCNNVVLQKGNLQSKADVIGKTDYDLWPDQADTIRKNDLKVMSTNEVLEQEELVILRDGTQLFFSSIKSPLKDKKNNTVGIVGNSFDTTLLKQAQKQAEMANLAKTQFLALMSHELRTPLTGIICSANILAEMDKMPSEAIEFIGYIIESGQYLLSTVNNILDFAKLEANQFKLITSQINLRRTVEEIINILKVVAKEKKLDLFLEYENTLPANVIADPRVIRHILTNLVSNAIKFTDQGKITIQVRPLSPNRYPNFESLITPLDNLENDKKLKSCFFEIAVSDTGMGIPADKLDLIFNKFSQLEDDPYVRKKSHYGSGLGLTITKKMAELMGGKINVTSELGKGSTFCLIAKFNY